MDKNILFRGELSAKLIETGPGCILTSLYIMSITCRFLVDHCYGVGKELVKDYWANITITFVFLQNLRTF